MATKKQKDLYKRNVRLFRTELRNYREWDFSFSLSIFARSLTILSRAIKDGSFVGCERTARKCLYAAERLRRLSNGEYSTFYDKQRSRLWRAQARYAGTQDSIDLISMPRAERKKLLNKNIKYRFANAMLSQYIKKSMDAERQEYIDVFNYIAKHIPRWWD